MSIGITARYLDIEWQEPGLARRVEASPEPVEIEQADDGSLQLEVQIFPEDHAWLGLRLSGVLSRAKPAWNAPDGQRYRLIAVEDTDGVRWWVPALTWDPSTKRHLWPRPGITDWTEGDSGLGAEAVVSRDDRPRADP